jgi:hypothetical protein
MVFFMSACRPKLYLINQMGFDPILVPRLREIQARIEQIGYEVIEPFERGGPKWPAPLPGSASLDDHVAQNHKVYGEVLEDDFNYCLDVDVVAPILTGHDVESGSAAEIGVVVGANRTGKNPPTSIIAYRGDIRGGEPGIPTNGMIWKACRDYGKMCATPDEWYEALEEEYQRLTAA